VLTKACLNVTGHEAGIGASLNSDGGSPTAENAEQARLIMARNGTLPLKGQ
jgi:hypothetical protein